MVDFSIEATDGLERNRKRYERLLALVTWYVALGRYDFAAAWSVLAADLAWSNHPGFFVDPRLERLLGRVGKTIPAASSSAAHYGNDWPHKVLHVLTEAYAIGGHTRL